MAEILVSALTEAVVSQTIERISQLLIEEATSLSSVKDDVESLRNELRRIQCFLKSAHSKQEQDDRVRNWVAEVRNVACDIEDLIDTFIFKLDYSSYLKRPFLLRNLRKEIDSIKARIEGIFESKGNYGIEIVWGDQATGFDLQRSLRRSYPDHDEDDVIGLEHSMGVLKSQLMEERARLCIVPIVGMGGLGKTTLAKKVYNDRDVKQHFDCNAWVFVSQQYMWRDVFTEILFQVGFSQFQYPRINDSEEILEERKRKRETLNKLEEGELIQSIKNKLEEKRFLVVLDDVWRIEDWDFVKRVFPRGKKGSKVVVTTRTKELASHADPFSSAIEPPFLTSEESWELLHRKAFPRDVFSEQDCPNELELMGKEMVKKCGGLPLAIVVLGGLLRTKSSYDEWEKVERDVNLHLNTHSYNGVEEILALSYHDLPYYLKPCFLYLGNFLEDSEISCGKLIQLWTAEGLVTEPSTTRRRTMEEISEQYLGELIDRCMVQVVERDYTGVGVKTCRLHHLMRDFCVSKAREDNFAEVFQQQERNISTSTSSSSALCRRIAIHPGCNPDAKQLMHPRLRSLVCFDVSLPSFLLIVKSKNLRLLRVLEFGFNKSTRKCRVPTEIGDLIHLRYLGLKDGGRVILQSSIGNLRSLETMNLRDNDEVELPTEILRLARLKNLYLPFNTCFPDNFSWMTYILSRPAQIQTLKWVSFGPLLQKNKTVLSGLPNLRNLGVQFKSNEEVRSFLAFPNFKLSMLQSLRMSLLTTGAFLNLKPLGECVILSKLFLDGMISDSSDLEFLPPSLNKLTLWDSDLGLDPMPILEKLPNLRFLRLYNSYNGSEMVCGAQGFPRLETLQLLSLKRVRTWRVELGTAMPNLKRLYVKHIPELSMIPQELRYISSLRELHICDPWLASQVRNWQSVNEKSFSYWLARKGIKSVNISPWEWGKLVCCSVGVVTFLVYLTLG